MNWEMIGALAEAVGAAAVVVSLVYLGRQLHAGTSQAKASSYSTVMGRSTRWMADLGRDRESADIYLRGLKGGLGALDETERVQFILLVLGLMRLIEESFLHRHHGSFPEWADEAIDESVVDVMATRGFQDFWELRKHQFSQAFQAYVDTVDPATDRQVHGQDSPGGPTPAAS